MGGQRIVRYEMRDARYKIQDTRYKIQDLLRRECKINCCLTYNTGDLALPLGELARRKA